VARDEGVSAHHVKSGDTEQSLLVIHTSLLQHISEQRDGGVHGVGDDEEHGIGAVLGTRLGDALDNAGVGVEQIVSGHTGLAGHAGGDNNDVAALQGLGHLVGTDVSRHLGGGAAMGDISGNTGSADNYTTKYGTNQEKCNGMTETYPHNLPSYRESSVTLVSSFNRRERGWPIPPEAPTTPTL